jgi:chromosome segregation ATPase
LELQVSFANRDKESAQEALRRVEQERDAALEQQQESWREMKLTSQKVDSLLQLLTSKESEELKELKKQRERAKATETELANAKKRISDLESKIEGLVRSEITTTRSLEDSHVQIESYQTKVDKLERELEPLRRLDEAQKARDNEFEQIRTQLTMQEKEEVSFTFGPGMNLN